MLHSCGRINQHSIVYRNRVISVESWAANGGVESVVVRETMNKDLL